MPNPSSVLRELVEAAIAWRKTKQAYLAFSDSKSAPTSDVEASRKRHMQAVYRLDNAVKAFEELTFKLKKSSPKKNGTNLPWKKIVDSIAMAATALSKATDAPAHPIVTAKVIDMPQEK